METKAVAVTMPEVVVKHAKSLAVEILKPSNVVITPKVLMEAEEVLKTPNKIFCRYIRSPHMAIMVETLEEAVEKNGIFVDITTKNYSLVNGKPIAVMVAFISNDNLYIGWAKRNPVKVKNNIIQDLNGEVKEVPSTIEDVSRLICSIKEHTHVKRVLQSFMAATVKAALSPAEEEISFNKKCARRMAVIRALCDEINIYPGSSVMRSKSGTILPKVVTKYMDEFVNDATCVFKDKVPENVIINAQDINLGINIPNEVA